MRFEDGDGASVDGSAVIAAPQEALDEPAAIGVVALIGLEPTTS
jgi:hypothetical protein